MLWLSSATGGIVDGTLVCGLTLQLILFPIFLFWLGRLRPKDVGLDLTRLWPAVQLIVLIWIGCQILHITIFLLMAKPVEVNPAWGSGNWRFALSDWLGQLFGNCPFEEVLFRGFLLPQCLLLAVHWLPESKRWKHLLIALLLSQGVFAFSHIIFNMKNPEGQWFSLVVCYGCASGHGGAGCSLSFRDIAMTPVSLRKYSCQCDPSAKRHRV